MGDTRPLTNNEVLFSAMDLVDGPNDLNNSEDSNGRHFRDRHKPSSGILSPYNVNGRFIVIVIASICFVLSLILFIGTVVVGFGGGGGSGCDMAIHTSTPSITSPGSDTTKYDETTTQQSISPIVEPLSVTSVNGVNVKGPGTLVWSEEFETFDTTKWQHLTHDPSSNFFHFVNTRNNSFVKDGILFLKPTFTSDAYGEEYVLNGTLLLGRKPSEMCKQKNDSALCWKGEGLSIVHPIMAPAISTQESFTFRYGLLEIRAKMPAGDWVEPLMSMQPNETVYGTDIDVLNGQIQMIDTRGNRKLFNHNGINVGSEQTCPDIRLGNVKMKRYIFDCLNTKHDEGFDTEFHTYSVEWTPDSITLKIDGEGIIAAPYPRKSMFDIWSRGRVHTNPWIAAHNPVMAPFDRQFYLVLGINVGGVQGFFSEDFTGPYLKPWRDMEPGAAKSFWDNRHDWEPSWGGNSAAMQVDYVRLYALNQTVDSE